MDSHPIPDSSPLDPDRESVRRVRAGGLVALIVLVLTGVGLFLNAGDDLSVVGWVFVPIALGIATSIRMIRHPEGAARLPGGNPVASILEQGGLDLTAFDNSGASPESRLAILDALDVVEKYSGSQRMSRWGRVAAGVGALGWWGAAAVAWVNSQDPAAVAFCVVAGGAFAALGWFQVWEASRERAATELLKEQLAALESGPKPTLGSGPMSGGAV